jgi:hypothetical protein
MIAKIMRTESDSPSFDHLNRLLDLFANGSITLDEVWASLDLQLKPSIIIASVSMSETNATPV